MGNGLLAHELARMEEGSFCPQMGEDDRGWGRGGWGMGEEGEEKEQEQEWGRWVGGGYIWKILLNIGAGGGNCLRACTKWKARLS